MHDSGGSRISLNYDGGDQDDDAGGGIGAGSGGSSRKVVVIGGRGLMIAGHGDWYLMKD